MLKNNLLWVELDRMSKNEENNGENILFTIKELDVVKTQDGNDNLRIKATDELIGFFNGKGIRPYKQKSSSKLTSRELDVLKLLIKGKNNTEIAKELVVSKYTIKAHVANILQKLNVNDRVQAVVKAISEKII